jgi:hypothetical protein
MTGIESFPDTWKYALHCPRCKFNALYTHWRGIMDDYGVHYVHDRRTMWRALFGPN